ncbi:MAG: O-antigen ligase family protein [Candidatus Gottesmanbacteria bacterium]|nr:O-antigen ligase family protein [Candidatus Gottesmanbacteria bacterium]
MAIIREQGFLILFGFVITISLFLGDGKQPLIDVVWAVEILLLYAIYHLQNRKLRVLPRTLHVAWVMLLGYCVVRTVFSDSVGYSLSTVIRLFDAYLVYRLFYSLADKKRVWYVGLGVICVGVVATIASFGCLSFPQFIHWLPQMNLLYASYGHNQLAGLLLFGIPLVIAEDTPIPSWCKKAVFVLFLSGLVFSFARGAWILLAAYLAFLLVTKRLAGKFNTSMAILFIGAVAGLLVSMFLLAPRFAHEPPTMNNNWLYKQTIKPPIYESRIQYWLQALRAIQERPIFGSGPGTFYLQSKRLQVAPLSYSWFAHSFVLEQVVEVGLVGTVLWGILFVVQGRLLIHPRANALLAGVILTFLYSLFDYSLSFLVIWLLFWSALGWLTGSVQSKEAPSSRSFLFTIGGLVLLFVFSLLSIGGMIETAVDKSDTASLFTPFVADVAITSIEKHTEATTPIPQKRLSLLLFFHRKNPDIILSLARHLSSLGMVEKSYSAYYKTLLLDPQNNVIFEEYSSKLLDNNRHNELRDVVEVLTTSISQNKPRDIEFLVKHWEQIYPCFNKDSLLWPQKTSVDTYQAKSLYYAGLCLVKRDQQDEARELLRIASDSRSGWSNIYLDYAALSTWRYHDTETAQRAIKLCEANIYARKHCEYYDVHPLPEVSLTDPTVNFQLSP